MFERGQSGDVICPGGPLQTQKPVPRASIHGCTDGPPIRQALPTHLGGCWGGHRDLELPQVDRSASGPAEICPLLFAENADGWEASSLRIARRFSAPDEETGRIVIKEQVRTRAVSVASAEASLSVGPVREAREGSRYGAHADAPRKPHTVVVDVPVQEPGIE